MVKNCFKATQKLSKMSALKGIGVFGGKEGKFRLDVWKKYLL